MKSTGVFNIVLAYCFYVSSSQTIHMEQEHGTINVNKPTCSITSYSARFDCDPGKVSSKSHCESKGCCWNPVTSNDSELYRPTNIPYCYFPSGYDGYHITNISKTKSGYHVVLERTSHSGWPGDVMGLSLDIFFETETRLHFKITDPNRKRYEVPLSTPHMKSSPAKTDYVVAFQKAPFGLKITRKSTSAILFDSTMPEAPLIFADQFIQISTHTGTGLVYGLGEHMTPLLLNGSWQQLNMWNRDISPQFSANLYGSHPFYLNIEPDGKAHGVFLLNSNAMDVDLQPLPALTFRTIGGILDFYVFTGPGADQVIQQYTDVIGKPFMPPYWSLGFHLCRWGYNSSWNLSQVIQRNRAINIPYDVQWSDIDYMDQFRDWTYNTKDFSTLPDIVKDLHQHGQKYVIIVDPGISNSIPGQYPPYDEGIKDEVFIRDNITGKPIVGKVWPGQTVFPDFTHPNASAWWYRQAKHFHDSIPFDGLWTDMNEPSNAGYGSVHGCSNNNYDDPPYLPGLVSDSKLPSSTLCPSASQYLSSHYNLHNMYGLLESRATYSALKEILNKRSIVISRSTYPSQGHYGGHWTGDIRSEWLDMQYTIPGILNFNMFGIPFVGADICGFSGSTTEELCIRWMQLGAFYPFMRNHNAIQQKDQDPAAFSSTAQDAIRRVLEMRYLLLPYMYTQFHHSHTKGTTVVKPLFFNFPFEPETYKIDRQFMWADGLLISPVLDQGQTIVRMYLPKAIWYDICDPKPKHGQGNWITMDTPLNKTNVHVKGGVILPLQKPAVTTSYARKQAFSLFVALDKDEMASGDLFWDDGESLDTRQQGAYNFIMFTSAEGRLESAVTRVGYKCNMTLSHITVTGLTSKPTAVTVNGETVNYKYDDKQALYITDFAVDLKTPLDVRWK